MSSGSNDGYCLRISSGLSPALRNSITVCTVIRFPRIMGLPPHSSGSITIRSTICSILKVVYCSLSTYFMLSHCSSVSAFQSFSASKRTIPLSMFLASTPTMNRRILVKSSFDIGVLNSLIIRNCCSFNDGDFLLGMCCAIQRPQFNPTLSNREAHSHCQQLNRHRNLSTLEIVGTSPYLSPPCCA